MTDEAVELTEPMHRVAFELELYSGLLDKQTGLTFDEWRLTLAPLGPVDARVVVLWLFHGLTERQIAERLEVTRTRVWQRLKRAVSRLSGPKTLAALGAAR